MSREEDIFLDEVRRAKPELSPSAEEWAGGERGRQILERILAEAAQTSARPAHAAHAGRRRSRRRWWAGPRLAFVAGAVVVVAVAVTLAVIFAVPWANEQTATGGSTPGATSGTQAAGTTGTTTDAVTKLAAVEDLLPLYREEQQRFADRTVTTSLSPADEAVSLGLLSKTEVADSSMAKPMTEGAYCVLLVKAFAPIFPVNAKPPADQATLTEAQAVDLLKRAGVILDSDGSFNPDTTLTKTVESRLLGRIQEDFGEVFGG